MRDTVQLEGVGIPPHFGCAGILTNITPPDVLCSRSNDIPIECRRPVISQNESHCPFQVAERMYCF